MKQYINFLESEEANNQYFIGNPKLKEAVERLIKENKEQNDIIKTANAAIKDLQEKLKNYIPVSLVEEKRTKLKEQYNKIVNEINNQGIIDQLIDFKEVSAKLEICEELLERRK